MDARFSGPEVAGCVGSGGDTHGVLQDGVGDLGARRRLLMLADAEDWFDLVQLGTVGRQEVEADALGPQRGQGGLGGAAAMQAGIVHDDHQGYVGAPREAAQEGEQVSAGQGCASPPPRSARARRPLDQRRQDIEPPDLRALVGNALAFATSRPRVRLRLARTQSALVEVAQGKLPRRPFSAALPDAVPRGPPRRDLARGPASAPFAVRRRCRPGICGSRAC